MPSALLTPTPLIAGLHLPTPLWWFYALGPQLLLCLGFGLLAWQRRRGDLITWLTWSCLASLVPVAGVLLMVWLWARSPATPDAGRGGAPSGGPRP